MIIEKIEIDSFASHRGVSFDLSDGVNLIEGSNESGKSSIADFIKFIFYGANGKASDGHLAERKRAVNFHASHAAGSLTVRVGEKHLKISRTLTVSGTVRESVRNTFTILDLDTGVEYDDKKTEPGEQILGIPEKLFCACAYMKQGAWTETGGSDINEAISNILYSGDESLSLQKAIDRIDKARIPFSHKHGATGRIYELKNEITTLRTKLASEMSANEEIIALQSFVEEKKAINAEHAAKSAELKLKKKAYENAKILESFNSLEDARKKYKASEMDLLEFRALAHIPTEEEMDELSGYERSLGKLEGQISLLNAELMRAEAEKRSLGSFERLRTLSDRFGTAENLSEAVKKALGAAKRSYIVSACLLALSLAGIALATLPQVLLPAICVSAASAAAALVFLVLGIASGSKAKKLLSGADCKSIKELTSLIDAYNDSVEHMTELDTLCRTNSALISEYTQLSKNEKERLSEFLLDMDIEDMSEPTSALSKITETLRARMRKAAQLELDHSTSRAYYQALCQKTDNIDAEKLKQELDDIGISSPLDCDVEVIEKNILFYEKQSEILGNSIHEAEIKLAQMKSTVSSPSKINEQIDALTRELEESERRHSAYTLATEALKTAGEELRRSIAPRLAKKAGEYMSALTDGRYGTLALDSDFSLSFEAASEMRHIDYLSLGTRDAAYLSLRLALADTISLSGPIPMIFDEATAHLDDTRAENLIKLLLHRSEEEHQHVLFTCHGRENAILSNIGEEYNLITL